MRHLSGVLFGVLAYIATATLFQYLKWNGVLFSGGLVGMVLFSLFAEERDTYSFSAVFGLLQGIFSSHLIGLHLLIYLTIAYGIHQVLPYMMRESAITLSFLSLSANLIYHLLYYLVAFLLRISPPLQHIMELFVVDSLYTLAVTWFLFMLIKSFKKEKYD